MKLSDFDYNLPKELIAQEPVNPRDHSRLLIYNRENKKIEHQKFYDIIDYLNPGDILFVNNSKVFSARLEAYKKTGGKIEIFLLKNIDKKKNTWECLIGGKVRPGLELDLIKNLKAQVIEKKDDVWHLSFDQKYDDFIKIVEKIGQTPLPPYIKRDKKNKNDIKNYQTIYANDEKLGSSAAPTAGLHFTEKLLKKIKGKGVEILEGTLHVGLGTFLPIKTEDIREHQMHSEEVEISLEVLQKIIQAKKEGRRIIAVGTTSARILESLFKKILDPSRIANLVGWHAVSKAINFSTDIFIYPGYQFKIVDSLITNFHLPKSSLLLMISALIGREETLDIYKKAIAENYRFFSYGDAMLII
ncbi:MAG: tRNA preQ1(34) S-adenosylmethionine ribosyltransferase-isomerase QueA [Patescibacteria group bacterium]|nr:tRNA preQ1(34) S-adenosylmethionine ribosyltransferase-isomerase QueA [Patescibacteria group bacterium]